MLATTHGGQFVAKLAQERRAGNVSPEAEQRLKRAFRAIGWDASDEALANAIGDEIARSERDVDALQRLRAGVFGEG